MCEWSVTPLTPPITRSSRTFRSVNAPGVAADISHINTPSTVQGYLPADGGLEKALKGADIVVVPAGVPRKVRLRRRMRLCCGVLVLVLLLQCSCMPLVCAGSAHWRRTDVLCPALSA